MKTKAKTSETNKQILDNYFIEVECKNEYFSAYIDYNKALDIIQATEDDNIRMTDEIKVDRKKVLSRSSAEAKRQAENPDAKYILTPKKQKALIILKQYFPRGIDLQGTIENGVRDIKIKSELEKIFRRVNKETKEIGSPNVSTINQFTVLFNSIQKNHNEERVLQDAEGVLFYASRK
jgi:hypothetical protein